MKDTCQMTGSEDSNPTGDDCSNYNVTLFVLIMQHLCRCNMFCFISKWA